ncbi:tetratricopeptide repeat protein [Chloroflexus sp.]|uniref:tetratricopeptide repeat protein n=1 Tax=Chloroflexus sp. TaxID=1904827 RepID=UPI002ACE35BE|nr:tetratricopeptide repeat protein [Chloroflexus sp.]
MATISLQDAYTQARTFLEANQIEQAIGLTQHILAHHSDNLEAQRLLGEAYLAQRDLPAAVATFEQVLQADPENIPAHVGLGMAYEWQGRLDKAIAEFEQALEIRPDMPELRAQLVRLYTEAWGSEHAALRLSRSGLARLYARGHMLPQAIHEFRNVIAEHPERLDAWVGLIEALWRDGRLDEAVEACQQALQAQPQLLKAHLILGALLLEDGDQRGFDHWRIAQRLDPYQTVARMLFDPLPVGAPTPDVLLPAWDEAEWRAQRAAAAAPAAVAADDDFFAEASWLAPAAQPAAVASAMSDDDLLAMLLFSPPATSVASSPQPATLGGDAFDFDLDLPGPAATPTGLTLDEIGVNVAATAPAEPELAPFSLEELGLSPDEIAQLEGGSPAVQAAEPALTPFSLEELGLSPDEIAQLEGGSPAQGLTPFSLEELGLPVDEAARSQEQGTAGSDAFADELSGLQPFSLDDLDFGASAPAGELPPSLQPFSLDDLALDEAHPAPQAEPVEPGIYSWQEPSMRSGGIQLPQEAEPSGPSIFSKLIERAASLPPIEEPPLSSVELTDADVAAYFSNDDVSLREDDGSPERLTGTFRLPKLSLDESLAPSGAVGALSGKGEEPVEELELTPFSLEELSLSPEEIAQLEAMQQPEQPAAAEPELTPFSLEELGLSAEEIAQLEAMQQPEQPAAESKATKVVDESLESLFAPTGSVDSNVLADLGISPAEAESSFALPGVEPFSLDEFGDLEPFSFEDLEGGAANAGGELAIPPEEIDNLNLGNFETVVFSEDEEPMIDTGDPVLNRLIQLGHRQGYVDLTDIIALVKDPEREADRIEQLGWSLHQAGIQLRDGDEIIDLEAEIGEEEAGPAALVAEADLTPFAEEVPAVQAAEPELTPFSLEEMGLSAEEIAQLEVMQQGEQPAAIAEEPELAPFSLEELGLTAEEIAQLEAMQQGEQPAAQAAEEDLFDFSVAEAVPVAKAVRTTPRVEEPPPSPKPEDASFKPEPLDALDDIWQAPPESVAPEPARVVLPPLSERAKPQPASRAAMAEERRSVAPTRDELRFARREAATAGRGRSARAPLRPRAPEDFIPTGNAKLDDYLRQLSANPANHTLVFTIARLCAQIGQAELMAVVYRRLLKQSALLARIAEELEDLINTVDDITVLRQLHRLLGDVYSRQDRLDEAIAAYSVTFAE